MRVCQFRHDGNVDLQCSGGREAAVSGRSTFLFYSHVTGCQTADAEAALRTASTPASPSWISSRSILSIPDSPSPLPPHISETPPHPLPEPFLLHRCGSM